MTENPVETFQQRVGTPSGLPLILDATVIASGPGTQVCALGPRCSRPWKLRMIASQGPSQGRWRCPWRLVPRSGKFPRWRGPQAPPMAATASQVALVGVEAIRGYGGHAAQGRGCCVPCGPAALPTACETSYPHLQTALLRHSAATGARPRSRGQARAAWRSRPRLTACPPGMETFHGGAGHGHRQWSRQLAKAALVEGGSHPGLRWSRSPGARMLCPLVGQRRCQRPVRPRTPHLQTALLWHSAATARGGLPALGLGLGVRLVPHGAPVRD